MLEGIEDGELWLWFGLTGSLNDLNVLKRSVTMRAILGGNFPRRMTYTINGTTRSLLYFLPKGIYPKHELFVNRWAGEGITNRRQSQGRRRKLERMWM